MNSQILLRPMGFYKEDNRVEQKLFASGLNTGNIIWYESVKEMVNYKEEKIDFIEGTNKYLLPLSNNIAMYSNMLESIANRIKKGDEVVIIGLGAQLTDELDTPRKLVNALPEERKKAIFKLSNITETIGIRGEITAECLDLIGVKNYKIIGCPSLYTAVESVYSLCHRNHNKNENSLLSINLASYGKKQLTYFMNTVKAYFDMKDIFFVMQDMRDLPKTLYENLPVLKRHMDERFPDCNVSAEEMTSYIRNNGKMFFSKDEWIKFFLENNIFCSTGFRFHGNMAALLSGCPAVWLTHDSRTRELCRAMNLPSYDLSRITEKFCFEDIYMCLEKYNLSFWEEYKKMYSAYINFLLENEVEIKVDRSNSFLTEGLCKK